MNKRIDYFWARTSLYFFGGFWVVGSLPRMLGIIQTKPEFANIIPVVDVIATVGFFGALFYTMYALIHNARLNASS